MRKPPASAEPTRPGAVTTRAPVLALMARVGYAARGVVYLVIGGVALSAAIGSGTRTVGNKGVAIALLREPSGRVLLEVAGGRPGLPFRVAGALRSLEQNTYGWILGFMAFGAYEVVQTAYRRIDVPRT